MTLTSGLEMSEWELTGRITGRATIPPGSFDFYARGINSRAGAIAHKLRPFPAPGRGTGSWMPTPVQTSLRAEKPELTPSPTNSSPALRGGRVAPSWPAHLQPKGLYFFLSFFSLAPLDVAGVIFCSPKSPAVPLSSIGEVIPGLRV